MQKIDSSILAIIFDLGGVLLNIDFSLTQKAFADMGMEHPEKLFGQYAQAGFFDSLDKGQIGEIKLYDELRSRIPQPVSDEEARAAWNAMILDFPRKRLDLLIKLKNKYRLFLLSNTNEIHYNLYNKQIQDMGFDSLEFFFEKSYFSFRDQRRKPDAEYFLKVLKENNLIPSKTLFLDDSSNNISAAEQLGILTVEVTEELDITEILADMRV